MNSETERSEQKNRGNSPGKRIVRNVSVLMAGRALNAPLALAHTSLAIRLLGAEEFGLVILLYAFARTIADFVDFQSWQTILHFGTKPLQDGNKPAFFRILRFSLTLDALAAGAGVLCGVLISIWGRHILGWPDSLHIMGPLYCISILFMASATPIGVLRLLDRFDLISTQGIVSTCIRFIGTVILWLTNGGMMEMALVWILAEMTAGSVLMVMATKELRRRNLLDGLFHSGMSFTDILNGPQLRKQAPNIWSFTLLANLNTTLTLAFSHVGTLIIGSQLGPAAAGYYRIAGQIASGIAKPAIMAQSTLYPEMARLWSQNARRELYLLAARAAGGAGLLGTCLLGATWFFGDFILDIIAGPHGNDLLALMLWLLAAEVLAIWGLPLEPLLFTMHRTAAVIISRALDTLLYLPLLVIMVNIYGLGGAGPTLFGATGLLLLMQLGFITGNRRTKTDT